MTRNLKALGVVLGAVFALGALMASSASAQTPGTLTAGGPVTLKGTETATAYTTEPTVYHNAFTNELGKITCDPAEYTGHKVLTVHETETGKTHELLPNGSTETTITPHYTNCKAHIPILGTREVVVTMNGCDFVFHSGETTGGVEGTYGVTADIVCPTGKKIDVHIYNLATSATICTITVGPKNGISGAHLTHTNTGEADDIDLAGTFTGIHEEHEGTACGTGTSNEAKLDVDVTIKGYKANGEETPVTITH